MDSEWVDYWKNIRGIDVCDYFIDEAPIREYEVRDDTSIAELIARHVGEPSRIYSRDDLEKASERRSSRGFSREKLLETAEYLARGMPSLYLTNSRWSQNKWVRKGLLWEDDFEDGDVLLIRRNAPYDVLDEALKVLEGPREEYGGVWEVADAPKFFEVILSQSTRPHQSTWGGEERFKRPGQIALLYTEEDADVAAYVRTHHHELDIASGKHCNLYFIENPGAIAPVRYWRPLLGAKLHAAWKLLGWANSIPYDKAQAYEIAQRLGVRFDQLPCAVVLVPGSSKVAEVVPLKGHLTTILRGLLARFQESPGPAQAKTGQGSEHGGGRPHVAGLRASGPIVFLSHASADKPLVRSVAVQLQAFGIEAWFDEISAGDSPTREIERGLARAEIMVLFLSRRSLASTWAEMEMRAALHAQIEKRQYRAIVPVIVDDCEIPPLLQDYRPIRGANPAHIVEELRATLNDRANDEPPSLEPIRHTILFLAATPSGTDSRTLDREMRAIEEELERSGFRDRFELVIRCAAEPLDLLRALRKLRPTVLHFSGHGTTDTPDEHRSALVPSHISTGESADNGSAPQHGLYFQSPDGNPQLVSTSALQETFGAAGTSVKLVVLNACYSELQAKTLLSHVGCVVGMSGFICNEAARSFASGFYGGLGEGESVAAAFKQGCAAIHLEGLRDSDRPQLVVRADIDASKLILSAAPRR